MKRRYLTLGLLATTVGLAVAQTSPKPQFPDIPGGERSKFTEIYSPVPPIITPGNYTPNTAGTTAPSDAIVLFDGKNTDQWVSAKSNDSKDWNGTNLGPLKWSVQNGVMYSTQGSYACTKQQFDNFQLHLEFKTPERVEGNGQGRGNSGVFLQGHYEIQVLDNYNNPTYSNGQVGSVYKQAIPLANPSRKPGEWQSYDIIYKAPRFNKAGIMVDPAYVTVFLNGVLVQNNTAIKGNTDYIGYPTVEPHGKGPIMLQDHGNPVGFRNIWIREL